MRTLEISRAVTTAFALVIATSAFAADDGVWSVKKTSGDVWMSNGSDVHQASVKSDEVLKPGDTVTTGKNGRVLLVRGEESILIAPNSVIGLPSEKKEGLATTIKQQAGSILLEVEKKNVRHFEVETPYLAAVVKGTQFRVTVNASGATVDVVRGQVEVADFKTGQIAQVMPGQHAGVSASGNAGLTLGGAGALQPIQQGQPRATSVDRVPVPRNGLSAPGKPTSASLQQKPGSASAQQHRHNASGPRAGVVRISASLGEVKLNVHRATHGLARSASLSSGSRAAGRDNATIWDTASNTNSNANASSSSASSGNGESSGNGVSGGGNSGASGAVSGVVAGATGVVGNGNNGNGNGNGNGNNGLHIGWVNGNGNAYGRNR